MKRAPFTKDELIVMATTHVSLEIRKAACESIYQCGRVEAAMELREVLAKPATQPNKVTP